MPPDIYKTLIELAHEFDSRVFLDTSGEPFKFALAGKPDFVKPNREEAESWSEPTDRQCRLGKKNYWTPC